MNTFLDILVNDIEPPIETLQFYNGRYSFYSTFPRCPLALKGV